MEGYVHPRQPKEGVMSGIEVKSFDSPDETRQFAGHGHAEVCEVEGRTVLRTVFEPGWHWKDDIGPIAGTDTCQTHHFGYCVQGRMKVVMDDGAELTIGPVTSSTSHPAMTPRWWATRPVSSWISETSRITPQPGR